MSEVLLIQSQYYDYLLASYFQVNKFMRAVVTQ